MLSLGCGGEAPAEARVACRAPTSHRRMCIAVRNRRNFTLFKGSSDHLSLICIYYYTWVTWENADSAIDTFNKLYLCPALLLLFLVIHPYNFHSHTSSTLNSQHEHDACPNLTAPQTLASKAFSLSRAQDELCVRHLAPTHKILGPPSKFSSSSATSTGPTGTSELSYPTSDGEGAIRRFWSTLFP